MVTRPDQQVGMEDIFEDNTITIPENKRMPTNLPGSLLKTPDMPPDMPAFDISDMLVNRDNFAEAFTPDKLTAEELNELFPKQDYKSDKYFALAKAGLALMQPQLGGAIGPAISNAGAVLLNDIGQIRKEERTANAERKKSMLTYRQKEEADRLGLKLQAFGINQNLLQEAAFKEYEAQAKRNAEMWENYNSIINTNMKEALEYGIDNFKSEPVTLRYTNKNGKKVEDAGFLVGNQYYIPTNQKDTNGEWIYELVPDPRTVEIISTKNQDVDNVTKGMSQYLQVRGAFDTVDKAIYSLDKIILSIEDDPSRAGFIAGLEKKIQSYAKIFSDFTDQFFEGDNAYLGADGKEKTRAAWITDMVDVINYSNDSSITPEMKEKFKGLDRIFDQLESEGAALLRRDFESGNPLNPDGQAFENNEQRDLIFGRLQYDKKLPENEARARAIIYALARARKSSGRLNLDDINKAAQDVNIYGDDSIGVIEKLKVVREDLMNDRRNQINNLERMFPDSIAELVDERGTTDYNFDFYEDFFKQNQPPTGVQTYTVEFDEDGNAQIIGAVK
jgi:hypothetical protein